MLYSWRAVCLSSLLMAHQWKPERCWTMLRLRHLYPSDWFKVFLCSTCSSVWHWWCGPYPVNFQLQNLAVGPNKRKIGITAIVVPKVTCDLPLAPVPFQLNWEHLADLTLADPGFGQSGRIDMLLGVDVFLDVPAGGAVSQGQERAETSKLCGINQLSPLIDAPRFKLTRCFPQDVMHILLEGVVPHEFTLLVSYPLEKKFFSLPELNSIIESFKYNSHELTNKPSIIQREAIRGIKKIGQNASQMWLLAVLFPLLIG